MFVGRITTPKPRLTAWFLLVFLLVGVAGCLNPHKLAEGYLRLSIEHLHPDANLLRLKVYFCDQTSQPPLLRERQILTPLGVENLYLPPLPKGHLFLSVETFQKFPNTEKEQLVGYHYRDLPSHEGGVTGFSNLQLTHGRPTPPPTPCHAIPTPPRSKKPATSIPMLQLPSPTTLNLPGAPATPPSSTDTDRLVQRGDIYTGFPSWGMAAFGNRVLIGNASGDFSADSMTLVDGRSNVPLRTIELPDNCKPQALDTQGTLTAVVCAGSERLLLRSLETGAPVGSEEGWKVGKGPTDVRISGPYVMVVNRHSNNISILRLQKEEKAFQTLSLQGTNPTSVTALNGEFFVAHAGVRPEVEGQISSFYFTSQGTLRVGKTYATGRDPQSIAVNGGYLLSANRKDQTLTIYNRRSAQTEARHLYLHGTPQTVALLSHTALVATSDAPLLYVIDLKTQRVTQTLKLNAKANRIVITGEWVLLSNDEKSIMRYQFATRHGLLQLRIGAALKSLSLQQQELWLRDSLSQQTLKVHLEHVQELILPNTLQKVPMESFSLPGSRWMETTSSLLLHTSENGRQLHFRVLSDLQQETGEVLPFKLPIKAGQIHNNTAYLSHWDTQKDEEPAFLTRIQLNNHNTNKPWDAITTLLPFGKQTTEIISALPWSSYILLLDQKNQNLYLTEDLFLKNKNNQLEHKDTLTLPGKPLKMVALGSTLAILFHDLSSPNKGGFLMLLNLPSFIKDGHEYATPKIIHLDGLPGDIATHGDKHLLITDRTNDQVVILDTTHTQPRVVIRIPVGCSPTELKVWSKSKNEHFGITINHQDETLSIFPLPF